MTIYKPLKKFIVRMPKLPVTSGLNSSLFGDKSKHGGPILDKGYIKNAIMISSYKFFKELDNIDDYNKIYKNKKKYYSLLKYLIRMSSRPTPFGLFTMIGFGDFANDVVELKFINRTRFRARADSNWITKLVTQLEGNENILKSCHLFVNPRLVYVNGRISSTEFIDFINPNNVTKKSIKSAELLLFVFKLLKRPQKYGFVLKELSNKYNERKEIFIPLLNKLIRESFIITDLYPPLDFLDPVGYLIKKVCQKDIRKNLITINNYINRINYSQNKRFLRNYKSLKLRIDKLLGEEQADYIRLENILDYQIPFKLPKSIGYEAAEMIELLLGLTTNPQGYSSIKHYKERFIGKYGEYVLVPLVDLFDTDTGLGSPYQSLVYTTSNSSTTMDSMTKRNFILSNMVEKALSSKSFVIKLTETDVKNLKSWNGDIRSAPDSMNIYLSICAHDYDDIKNNKYKLSLAPAGGNEEALSVYSRIFDILNSKIQKEVLEIVNEEKAIEKDNELAEIYAFPGYRQLSDIIIHRPFYKYAIFLDQMPTDSKQYKKLEIKDLYVGIRDGKFHIYSLSLNKEVVVHNTTLINEEHLPLIARFLIDASNDGKPILERFSWGQMQNLPFLPRLEFKKYIISTAQWNISKQTFDLDLQDFIIFSKSFKKYAKTWRIPEYINIIGQFDHRILIDLNNPDQLLILYESIKKLSDYEFLRIEEALPNPNELIVRGDDGPHIAEFVISLIKRNLPDLDGNLKTKKNASIKNLIYNNKIFKNGVLSKWMYIKIYITKDAQEDFIIRDMFTFLNKYIKNRNSKNFFIRYSDPEDHIRLRIKFNREFKASDFLRIYKWCSSLTLKGGISRFSFDLYEQELIRYGGPVGMSIAENFFAEDSIIVMRSLLEIHKGTHYNLLLFCAFLMDRLLEMLGFDIEYRLDIYKKITRNLGPVKTSDFTFNVELLYENITNLKTHYNNLLLAAIGGKNGLKELESKLNRLGKKLRYLQRSNKLTIDLDEILSSYLHMHCNRMLGVDRNLEAKAYVYIKRAIEKFYNLNAKKNLLSHIDG